MTQHLNEWELHPDRLTQTIGETHITVTLEDEQKYQQAIRPILDMIQDGETRGQAVQNPLTSTDGTLLTVHITIGKQNMAVRVGPQDGFPASTTLRDVAQLVSPHQMAQTALDMSRAALNEPK